ncbi:MAG: glycosyltransferase [candidate division KSB1 bacterium]|nr:glycosyltransferase [candidate division KSB1 bacterium]
MSESRTVAHIKRSFLAPTETFVWNQITTLKTYRPIVFCHHRIPNIGYPFTEVYSLQDFLPSLPRLFDSISYNIARHLSPMSAKFLAGLVLKKSVNLLHFHYLVDARFFLALKRLTQLPAVVSVYGYDVSSFPRLFWGCGQRYLQPIFYEMDCFIAMSHDMQRDLIQIGCPKHKIVVHYYGIDTDRFAYPERTYPEKKEVNILMCGTLEPKKAQNWVLEALHLWEKRQCSQHSFRITFMGEGPLRPRLESLVHEFGWEDRVCFLGHVPYHDPRLVEEYRQADIFALPSITIKGDKEGIPGTIVEAMACGLPVVSTYHAGIPEVITNGQDGLLVRERDLEGLSQALGQLIEDRALRERLGRAAARTAASRCRLLSRTPELERIYDQMLARELPRRVERDISER